MTLDHIHVVWHLVVRRIDEVSSLSLVESALMVGQYQHTLSGKGSSESTLTERGYSEAALVEARIKALGSFRPVESAGFRFTQPLDRFRSDILGYSLFLFENYERGQLPFPGSVSEQPAQIMEIFALIQTLRAEQDEKLRKKLESDVRNKRQNLSRNR